MVDYPYSCDIDIAFPTARHAEQTMKIMQVDQEIGDRVTKSFALVESSSAPSDGNPGKRILRVHFEATEAKMLRVSVSSFYDYLTVALKCYQEFDTTLR